MNAIEAADVARAASGDERPFGSSKRRLLEHAPTAYRSPMMYLLEGSLLALTIVTFTLFDAYARACDRI